MYMLFVLLCYTFTRASAYLVCLSYLPSGILDLPNPKMSPTFDFLMFLLGSPKAEQASRVQLRVTFSLNLFILACTSVHFWHYRPRFSLRNITLNTHFLLITDITGRIQAMCETVWKVLFLLYIILSSQS